MDKTKRRPGRPASTDRAPDGQPARVRLLWVGTDGKAFGPVTEQCEKFSSADAALRLLAAWAKHQCVPPSLRIERKTAAGWEPA